MQEIEQLNVFYHHRKVGKLAVYKKHLIAFESASPTLNLDIISQKFQDILNTNTIEDLDELFPVRQEMRSLDVRHKAFSIRPLPGLFGNKTF